MTAATPAKPTTTSFRNFVRTAIEAGFPGCQVERVGVGLAVRLPPIGREADFVIGINDGETVKNELRKMKSKAAKK